MQNYQISSIEPLSKNIDSVKELLDSFVEEEIKDNISTNLDKQGNGIHSTLASHIDSEQSDVFADEITFFFRNKKELLHSVYFKEEGGKVKTYYITLKNDSTENREIIFDFFENMKRKINYHFLYNLFL